MYFYFFFNSNGPDFKSICVYSIKFTAIAKGASILNIVSDVIVVYLYAPLPDTFFYTLVNDIHL